VRVNFADYLKAGDTLALDVDLANNRPTSAKVTTYLDSPSEPVTLNVYFSVLNGAATYPSTVSLNAPGKSLTVSVVNSGYRRMGY
jgi:hypothetical protein